MLESQNPCFRVLNLKTRVPKSMRKPGFSGSGSNPGSIPTSLSNNRANWNKHAGWTIAPILGNFKSINTVSAQIERHS